MSALREALRELPDAVFADVLESDEAYLLVLDLPGVTADDVEITIEHGFLQVDAVRNEDLPAEFEPVAQNRADDLSFEVPVPMDVTGDGAEASVEGGVLELTLPKQTATTSTTIPVTE